MRSIPPPTFGLRQRSLDRGVLPALAQIVDRATVEDPGHVLVHLAGANDDERTLGLRSLDVGVHPFQVLAGFSAPESWWAVGVRARGQARRLDRPERPPAPTTMTFLLDRDGAEASVLRLDGDVSEPPGPATGTVPDLCRRVLGLSTDPAPSSTDLLWTALWLDRVLAAWGEPSRRRALMSSWSQVAALHPAAEGRGAPGADTASLAALARDQAAATSWTDLRRAPWRVPLPDGPVEADVARWMDDGFFARWTIGAFPSVATMVTDLEPLLGDPIGPRLLEVVLAVLE